MSLRVCIPTAGTGSRLGELTRFINKSLVSIANRPTLSHLIEQFPSDTEFVIALGHKGHLVRGFLELAYPERVFLFEDVNPFEGPGSGLGWSLLQCQRHLQQPFIFLSCDTLVGETIPNLEQNWMGYAEQEDLNSYRTLQVESDSVRAICEKGEGRNPTHKPYIGLAGIVDYDDFWQAMQSGGTQAIESGEAYGLRNLLGKGISAHRFTWFDTGKPDELELTRNRYREEGGPNILEKANEAIWFVADKVIKFSDDESFIANRVKRATKLKDFVPNVTAYNKNMYCYPKAEGRVLSEVVTLPLFERFLGHCKIFWEEAKDKVDDNGRFRVNCMKFYRDKTFERVDLFYRNFQKKDGVGTINGVAMPTLNDLLNELDWDSLADGLPGRFHGDFHFENILWSEAKQTFMFLDWRQDFGGSLTTGDIYYDFAKLMHGLIINHELITNDHYWVNWENDSIEYDFYRRQALVECERKFEQWIVANGYNVKKMKILTALIYLNIAALHHFPYSFLLYSMGKFMLYEELEE